MRYGFLILFLILSGCSCGSGVDNSKDAGVDTGILCGNGYYPSFDYQCKGNTGCREINKGLCSCRCVMCEDERCVGMSCGGIGCEGDGGVYDFGIDDLGISDLKDAGEDIEVDVIDDVSDIRDISDIRDAGDVGIDELEYVCKDPGDPVGVDFWGNLDEPIVKISNSVYLAAIISGDYVVWQEVNSRGTYAKDIYYLSLKDRRVMRVPNCDGYDQIDGLYVEGNKVYWSNSSNSCSTIKKCVVIFEFDVEKRVQPRIVSLRDEAVLPKVYKSNMVYTIVGNFGPEKIGLYYTDLLNGNTKKLSDRWDILSEYSTTLWEREIIIGRRDGIYGLNIDTMEEKIHYKTNNTIICEPGFIKGDLFPFKLYLEKDVYGHYTTDIYVLDIRDDSVRQITDDEVFQHAPQIYKNLLAWHENENPSSSSVDIGYVVIYDLENGNKRRIPNLYGIGGPFSLSDKYMLYYKTMGSEVTSIDLVNLEKLGVVKDGHVVPE